jgi:hypothetical protein
MPHVILSKFPCTVSLTLASLSLSTLQAPLSLLVLGVKAFAWICSEHAIIPSPEFVCLEFGYHIDPHDLPVLCSNVILLEILLSL